VAALLPLVLFSAANAEAAPIYFNDFDGGETFEAGVTGGFSGAGAVESVQGFSILGAAFSGDFLRSTSAGNPAAASTLSLTGLAPNASIAVNISFAVIDSWDGSSFPPSPDQAPDFFNVEINGSSAFSESFTNLSTFGSVQSYAGPALAQEVALGFETGSSRLDSAYALSVVGLTDGAGTVTIDFFASGSGWLGAAGSSGPEEESWAIDNVTVVPEPGTALLLGSGLALLVGCYRKV